MWHKILILLLVLGCWVAGSNEARAESTNCALAYERAQELRAERHLRDALGVLKDCIEPSCSEFVRAECSRWLTEVEASLPSIVVAAKRGGRESQSVRVLLDEALLAEDLDGRSVVVDPGPHTLTFVAQGTKPVQMQLVFREGEKNRLVTVTFGETEEPRPKDAKSPLLVQGDAPASKWLIYGLGGVGVVGIGGFVALGLTGNGELADRERSCAPACSDAAVASIRTKYTLADVSLGIGVVSLAVAGYLLLTSPDGETRRAAGAPAPPLDVGLLNHGGYAVMRTQF